MTTTKTTPPPAPGSALPSVTDVPSPDDSCAAGVPPPFGELELVFFGVFGGLLVVGSGLPSLVGGLVSASGGSSTGATTRCRVRIGAQEVRVTGDAPVGAAVHVAVERGFAIAG